MWLPYSLLLRSPLRGSNEINWKSTRQTLRARFDRDRRRTNRPEMQLTREFIIRPTFNEAWTRYCLTGTKCCKEICDDFGDTVVSVWPLEAMHTAYSIRADDDASFTKARLWRCRGLKSRLLRLYQLKCAYTVIYTRSACLTRFTRIWIDSHVSKHRVTTKKLVYSTRVHT